MLVVSAFYKELRTHSGLPDVVYTTTRCGVWGEGCMSFVMREVAILSQAPVKARGAEWWVQGGRSHPLA